jgi:hypothetical protein
LIALTTACAGSPRIEYVYETPDVPAFPVFPPPDPVTLDEEKETVSMPLWYWQKIAEYKIDVDAIEEYLDRIRAAAPGTEAAR